MKEWIYFKHREMFNLYLLCVRVVLHQKAAWA